MPFGQLPSQVPVFGFMVQVIKVELVVDWATHVQYPPGCVKYCLYEQDWPCGQEPPHAGGFDDEQELEVWASTAAKSNTMQGNSRSNPLIQHTT